MVASKYAQKCINKYNTTTKKKEKEKNENALTSQILPVVDICLYLAVARLSLNFVT